MKQICTTKLHSLVNMITINDKRLFKKRTFLTGKNDIHNQTVNMVAEF